MTPYSIRFAELYDLFYADKSYRDEALFVADCFRRHGCAPPARVWELACGTGRHAAILSQMGYRLLCTDRSAEMLAIASGRAAESGGAIQVRQHDMIHPLPDVGPFDAAMCLFDSIGYVRTSDATREVLSNVARSLRRDGLLVLEFWHAAAMSSSHERFRVRRWTAPDGGTILRISETTLDAPNQQATVAFDVYRLDPGGRYQHVRELHVCRYYSVADMAALAADAGFEVAAWHAGFSLDAPITDATWHIIGVLKKR